MREARIFGVAGGADAGCSVEGVDFEAGVVGEDEEAGCVCGVVEGLGARVGLEGGGVLGWGGDGGERGEGRDEDAFAGNELTSGG
jgi:hypothetical protein